MPSSVALIVAAPRCCQGFMQFVVYVAYKFVTLSILYFLFIE